MNETQNVVKIGGKSVIIAVSVIVGLMILTYCLTLFVPAGAYLYNADGEIIADSFQYVEGGISFWKWLLSPILVLLAEGNGTLLAVMAFVLVIGAVFTALNEAGILHYLLSKIVFKYHEKKYKLLNMIILFFMAMGSLVGSFEEATPMIPLAVGIATGMGWDPFVGLGMSLLAVACGFATAISNPFTVGIAQKLAGLPMFSGIWMRILAFILIYILLRSFLTKYAKKVEKKDVELEAQRFIPDVKIEKAIEIFAAFLMTGMFLVLLSPFISVLQNLTMVIVAVMFLSGGIASVLASGKGMSFLCKNFWEGIVAISPSLIILLMAASIKYIMVEGKILDTILHAAVGAAGNMPKVLIVLFIYMITLVMNFFISTGSGKAILMIPLLVPMASMFGVSSQMVVLAYIFGDGFSNVFYPTNPVTIIGCSIAGVTYPQWAKFSAKFQLLNLLITSGLLVLGVLVGY